MNDIHYFQVESWFIHRAIFGVCMILLWGSVLLPSSNLYHVYLHQNKQSKYRFIISKLFLLLGLSILLFLLLSFVIIVVGIGSFDKFYLTEIQRKYLWSNLVYGMMIALYSGVFVMFFHSVLSYVFPFGILVGSIISTLYQDPKTLEVIGYIVPLNGPNEFTVQGIQSLEYYSFVHAICWILIVILFVHGE
ncbi:MAG: hypothetical protein U1C51_08505 [Candidatus Izemoplasmatales bacterium]|nr:hypothetical protein [Candidatus Izemoplasmatales bacterium]